MRALTLYEPWATLVAIEAKRYETRDWIPEECSFWLAIHSSKNSLHLDLARTDPFNSAIMHWGEKCGMPDAAHFKLGHVLAIAFVKAYHRTEAVRGSLSDLERAFGDYVDGRWAWEFSRVIRLPEPVPVQGQRKIWTWDPEPKLLAKMKELAGVKT